MLDVMRQPPTVATNVRWIACRVQMPDADRTVLMYHPELEDDPVGLGWWDGETWRAAESGGELGTGCVHWWADMPDPPEEPRPEPHLWCVHIKGPDDMVPAPGKAEAEAASALLNAAFDRMRQQNSEHVPMSAAAAAWPYGNVEHKADQHLFAQLLGSELQVAW